MTSRTNSLYSGIQVNRKFNHYDSTGKLEGTKNSAVANAYETNFVRHLGPRRGAETSMGMHLKGQIS